MQFQIYNLFVYLCICIFLFVYLYYNVASQTVLPIRGSGCHCYNGSNGFNQPEAHSLNLHHRLQLCQLALSPIIIALCSLCACAPCVLLVWCLCGACVVLVWCTTYLYQVYLCALCLCAVHCTSGVQWHN